MPRVVHLLDRLNRGGRQRLAVDVANATIGRGWDVTLCQTHDAGPLTGELHPDVVRVALGRRRRAAPGAILALRRVLRRADVVHVHAPGSLTAATLTRTLFAGCRRSALVYHEHRGAAVDAPPTWLIGWSMRRAHAVVVPSQPLAAWCRDVVGVAPAGVHVVANGVDLARFDADRRRAPEPDEPVVAVCVARLAPDKGHDELFRALSLARSLDRWRLRLVGDDADGTEVRLRALARELGIAGHVSFEGGIDDVPAALADAHVGVLASAEESGPLALAEYAAAGLPYVVADTGGITKVLAGRGGTVVPVGDTVAFAAALDALAATDPEELAAVGDRALAAVRECCSVDRAAEHLVALYNAVSAGAGGSRRGRAV